MAKTKQTTNVPEPSVINGSTPEPDPNLERLKPANEGQSFIRPALGQSPQLDLAEFRTDQSFAQHEVSGGIREELDG